MASLKPNTLHVDNLSPRQRSLSSGLSSACSSGSVSPVPIIPIISISRDGEESETESEIETEPARIFHRRMSTHSKRNTNLSKQHVSAQVSGAEVTCPAMQTHSDVHVYELDEKCQSSVGEGARSGGAANATLECLCLCLCSS
ncbi:hypothetical protein AWZ03_005604 [Drosophila navojoa]|uniref:Uncharacterized protein n=1 Tax=Drosophila navojoa TaxID=7232 RepID=A0A484BGJ1_DRONA|nr:hypothetical protein AWZ03_005604 [Drosophila navojoa]